MGASFRGKFFLENCDGCKNGRRWGASKLRDTQESFRFGGNSRRLKTGYRSQRRARACCCAYGLLGWLASESGRLCHGDGGHAGGARRRRALMLPILARDPRSPSANHKKNGATAQPPR